MPSLTNWLLFCVDKALDMWAAGVILLSFASGKFPFFLSNNDQEALLEIAHIFGSTEMEEIALKFGRVFKTNIPTVQSRIPFKTIVVRFGEGREDLLSHEGYDLLERLMTLDPDERITANDALNHPFFEGI